MCTAFRDYFVQNTGLSLFEETYLKLNLLLKDSFGWRSLNKTSVLPKALAFTQWYQWRPDLAVRVTTNPEQWKILISFENIDIRVEKWLEQELINIFPKNKHCKKQCILVEFANDVDKPTLLNKCSLPTETEQMNFLRTHKYNNQKFIDMCNKFCNSSISIPAITSLLKHDVAFAINQNGAVFFFPQGFYLAPSRIKNAGYGIFSLGYIQPAKLLFNFEGKRITPKHFESLSHHIREKIENFACEACFLTCASEPKQNEICLLLEQNYINLIFDPTNSKHTLTLNDLLRNPNAGPWMNEPGAGSVSNVFLHAFTCFNIPEVDLSRYMLQAVSARNIYPHDELLLHYDKNYCRKGMYIPGETCPDILPQSICL